MIKYYKWEFVCYPKKDYTELTGLIGNARYRDIVIIL